VNEDGGSLLGVLAWGFVGVALTVFGGDLVATDDGPDVVVGDVIVGGGSAFGISTGSGSTTFGGSGSARVGSRDGGSTFITLGISTGGEGDLSTSGGVASPELGTRGEIGLFLSSKNGDVWMVGWTGGQRCPEESPELCALSRGGQSLLPTELSLGVEVMLEVRGGHSLFSFTSALAESPVV
jgi:hypothetical protein